MTTAIDETHDPALRSWVESANGHPHFPIQNLPFGVFSPPGGAPRGGVAIGDSILDLAGLVSAGLLTGAGGQAAAASRLNGFLALGAGPRREVRRAVSALLAAGSPRLSMVLPLLHKAADCTMHLPCAIGDYTDFYVGIHHATNGGRLFRPDNPLMPNYKYVPVAYHSRASSVRPSGATVRRPKGQTKAPDDAAPVYRPSARLDFELELAVWMGPGNTLGDPIAIGDAADHIAGYGLLNDWSARDIQAWEAAPLGPFLGKNFSTSVSCWIVTPEALAPFRMAQPARPAGDPPPLPYLFDAADQASGALDLDLAVHLAPAGGTPQPLAHSHARHMYWTPAQMVAHHTCGGCDLHPGDLLGTGTISGIEPDSLGSLLELSEGGRRTVRLADGTERRFLEDGDEVILSARAHRDGFVSIGFGECRGTITPAM
ncbi:MAG TPA: fumarylacetoacetase [Rhodopila sp.]|uniref:fumarylacetoacetase n=1 Tax=Rhodopila sp. TaxID=2480087 RepID=UPI002BABBF25|nr:fumarylacetoacetase [Rhodopila sp.]HVY17451.1 fumarylacetoacetase [Rhodopila sp.]